MTDIHTEFDYDKGQVIQGLRYHFISKIEMRVMIILVNVFAAFALVMHLMGKITPTAFIINALLWMVLMVSLWFILPYMVYSKAHTFKNHFRMNFTDKDFSLIHDRGSKTWQYSDLQSFKETPNFFHLYFDPRSFFLVPKSGFKNQQDIADLRSLLRYKFS